MGEPLTVVRRCSPFPATASTCDANKRDLVSLPCKNYMGLRADFFIEERLYHTVYGGFLTRGDILTRWENLYLCGARIDCVKRPCI